MLIELAGWLWCGAVTGKKLRIRQTYLHEKKRGMQSRMKGGREHPVLHASAILESTVKKKGGANSLPALFNLHEKAVQAARKGGG
jgi:hypothetical protein